MTEYALCGPSGEITVYGTSANIDPTVQTKPGWRWLPVEVTNPSFNSATQVKEGPVVTVLADKVTRVWTVRAKTAQELADDVDAAQQAQLDMFGNVGFKALYLLDWRSRKLRGDPKITEAAFQAQLKALYNNPVPDPDPRSPPTILRFDASVTIGAVAGAAFTDKTFSVPGLLTTDLILSATFTAGLTPDTISYIPLRVSAVDTLAMRFHNVFILGVTPPAPQALSIIVWRP